MKYQCNIIKDILPLYHDDVCSKESREAIETHFAECHTCKEYYHTLCNVDTIPINQTEIELEMKKANSYQNMKKKLLRKQIYIVFIVILIVSISIVSMIGILKHMEQVISYDGTISVSMTDGNLIGRLYGTEASYMKLKRVEVVTEEQNHTYLFFYLSSTIWNNITTSDTMFSEYELCSAEKGAEEIDAIFYYTGDYTDIENMNFTELQNIIDGSVQLWHK